MVHSLTVVLLLIAVLSDVSVGRRRRFGNVLEDTTFTCPDQFGYYPHPENCGEYYVCVFGGALLESCTGGLMYKEELQTCDWPRNVVCKNKNSATVSTVKITDPRTASQQRLTPSVTELFSNSRGISTNRGDVTSAYSNDNLQSIPESKKVSEPEDQAYDALDQYLLEDFTLSEDKSVPRQGRLYRSQSVPKESHKSQSRPINQQVAASTVSSPSRLTPVRSQQYARPSQDPQYDTRYQQQKGQQQYQQREQQQHQQQQPPRQQQSYYQQVTTTTTTTSPSVSPYDYSTGGYYYNASDFYYYDDEFGYPPFEYYEEDTVPKTDTSSTSAGTSSSKSSYTPSSSSSTSLQNSYKNTNIQTSYQGQPGTQDVYAYNTQDAYIYPKDNLDQSRAQSPSQSYNNQQQYSLSTTVPKVRTQSEQQRTHTDNRILRPSRVHGRPRVSIAVKKSVEPVPIYTRGPIKTSRTRAPVTRNPDFSTRVTDAFSSVLQTSSGGEGNSITNNNPPATQSRRRIPSRNKAKQEQQRKIAALSSNAVNGNYNSRRTPNREHSNLVRPRPTNKPASTIVRERPPIDISLSVPSRPAPVYPQPPVDEPASRCNRDVCLLPDCNCGKGDVPGGLSPTEVPQIVLLTFDDAVNDLNKELYHDLFETGRKNPNGCPIQATYYVSHEWTDYGQVQNLYADGHEIASHSITHSFGEQFSEKKWRYEIDGMRDVLAAYGGVRREDVRGMRAPFLAIGGNRMFRMLYNNNYTYDSSMPVYENKPPSWPYTLDYKIFHDCMIPPCPTKSYPGVWEVPMVMWQDLNGGRCSMGDGCSAPPTAEGIYQMLIKNFERHYTSNRAPFGLFYHAAWFTKEHHKAGFEAFLDTIVEMPDVWLVTNWQALQWVRNPTPLSRIQNFEPFGCSYPERPRKCRRSKVCNLWHKSGVRYMRTCQKCPDVYPWVGKTGVYKSRN